VTGETMHPTIDRLVTAALRLMASKKRFLALNDEMLARPAPLAPEAPESLPVCRLLPAMAPQAAPETVAAARALIDAAPHLRWRQTYSEDDGFDRSYLARYGWVDLVGPNGPWQADGMRLMAGYWGQGLVYPNHAHPPEEHYLVLAGGAKFRLGQDAWRWLGPGEVFHTPAGAVHSADMSQGPLLALSLWRGPDVGVRIDLTGQGREVVLD